MANTQGKMCPLLTAGVLKKNEASADGVGEVVGSFDAMPCQGAACAFWMGIADETGKLTKDGNCAIPLAAVALSQLNVNSQPTKTKIVKG